MAARCEAQALCIPISICTTAVAALRTEVDLGLLVCTGATLALGVPLGVRISRRVDPAHLRLAIGLILLGIGTSALYKVLNRAVSS